MHLGHVAVIVPVQISIRPQVLDIIVSSRTKRIRFKQEVTFDSKAYLGSQYS